MFVLTKKEKIGVSIGVLLGFAFLVYKFGLFNAMLVFLMICALCCIPSILKRAKYLKRLNEYYAFDKLVTVMELIAVTVSVGVCITILVSNIK